MRYDLFCGVYSENSSERGRAQFNGEENENERSDISQSRKYNAEQNMNERVDRSADKPVPKSVSPDEFCRQKSSEKRAESDAQPREKRHERIGQPSK